ncbi:MAG: HNH endonuclease [Candidatus Dadabacteria bacterium]|nr:HNH endonuclease [Candidatus Dadabacteria bacterium]NIQ16913.1 HNH endonuclease [Candidatus Dadabacteria bacterium]
MLTSPVLVLNRFFVPVSVTSLKRAFILLYGGSAKAVNDEYETFDFESWAQIRLVDEDDCIRTVTKVIKAPRVIILLRYEGYYRKQPRFNRINIFRRDNDTCQYCETKFQKYDLTLDHVIPRALGGKSTWDNVVCCCVKCNRKKGGRTPDQAHMELLNTPKKPQWNLFSNFYIRTIKYKEWKPFLNFVEMSYWNVELQD